MTDLSPRQQLLEQISDKLCSALQSDLENGVSSLNAEAAKTFNRNYPALNDVIAWVHDLTWRKCLMSNPVPLSPAAQAVLDAANGAQCYGPDDILNDSRWIATAALRAAADQVAPAPPGSKPGTSSLLKAIRWERKTTREQLLAIADELEGSK